jgi:hypothetical protein
MSKRKYYQISFEAFSRDCRLKSDCWETKACELAWRLRYENFLCKEKNCPKLKRARQLFPVSLGRGHENDRKVYIGLYPDEIPIKKGKK